MVHQHFMLVENFTVLENVMLGAEDSQILNKGIAKARVELKRLEREYALEVDPDARDRGTAGRPAAARRNPESHSIAGAEILILDEPTGVLTPAEADHLFRILEQLKDQGKTVILITHKLREIMAITDEVSVMRRGEMVATRTTAETIGRRAGRTHGRPPRPAACRKGRGQARRGASSRSRNLTVKDSRGVTMVDNVSFDAAGRRDRRHCRRCRQRPVRAARGDFGHPSAPSSGERACSTASRSTSPAAPTPANCAIVGLAHVPEDRHHVGLVLKFEECENAILGYHHDKRYLQRRLPRSSMRSARMPMEQHRRNTISARRIRG